MLHAKQRRKKTDIPYVSHLLAVASIVLENGGNEDEAIAALLHDAPEDQGGEATLAQIRLFYGDGVGDIVEGCSDSLVDDTKEEKAPWRERKTVYINHLRKSTDMSVYLVSAADKLHNLRSIARDFTVLGKGVFMKFNGFREGTLWYYRSLATAYRCGPDDSRREPIVDEMRSLIDELERVGTHQGNRKITYGFAFGNEPFDPQALEEAIFGVLVSMGASQRELSEIHFGGMPSEYRGGLYECLRLGDRVAARRGFDGDGKLWEFRNAVHAVLYSFQMENGNLLGRTINAVTEHLKSVAS